MKIEIKRIYEDYDDNDGFRILVDRLWPRGISKEKAHVDWWGKDIAPSTEIRKEFGHKDDKWEWFQKSYTDELESNNTAVKDFFDKSKGKPKVTLLYGAKNIKHNHAVVLKKYLDSKM